MKIVRESIEFKRNLSDKEIRRGLRGDKFLPGEIVIRRHVVSVNHSELYIWLQKRAGNIAEIEIYYFGSMGRNAYGDIKAYFIHDTNNKSGKAWIIDGTYDHLNDKEVELVQQAFDSGKYDKYIEEAKKKTGLTPFI